LSGGLISTDTYAPTGRSAFHHRLRDVGATFEVRDGWLTPIVVRDEDDLSTGVWLVDLSHVGKLEVRGGPEPRPAQDRGVHRIAPGRWLVLCPRGARLAALAELEATADLALDMSGAWSVLGVGGASAQKLVRRLTTAPRAPASAPVADVPGHVLVRDGITWLLVSSEYGQHLWDVALDDGAGLGARPVGVDAVARSCPDPMIT
jgi:glycine cleavage system aminomethyltransferase T